MKTKEINTTRAVPAFYTVAQAAIIANVPEETIMGLIDYGVIQASGATGELLIAHDEVDAFAKR